MSTLAKPIKRSPGNWANRTMQVRAGPDRIGWAVGRVELHECNCSAHANTNGKRERERERERPRGRADFLGLLLLPPLLILSARNESTTGCARTSSLGRPSELAARNCWHLAARQRGLDPAARGQETPRLGERICA